MVVKQSLDTAAILKIDISPYLSEKSSDFHEILYVAADFKLYKRHVIKNKNFQNSRLLTAAILKIDISQYLSEQSLDFHKILYTIADFELDEHLHGIPTGSPPPLRGR